MRLVSVVTSTRSPLAARALHSPSRSSICPLTGRISTGGSKSPVGTDDLFHHETRAAVQFQRPGVAETKML